MALGDENYGRADFADQNVGGDAALERIRNRLSADVGPSTASSTTKWRTGSDLAMIRGRTPDATRIPLPKLEQMRRDPIIAFGLLFIKSFLARAPWYIQSTDPRRAAFIDGALRQIYGRLVLQWGGCLDFGYQALVKNFERTSVDWQYIADQTTGEKVPVWSSSAPPLIWKPFTALNARWSRPGFNNLGEFDGIWYGPTGGGSVFNFEPNMQPSIPFEWSMWLTNEKDSVFGSLYGYPRTGYAYRYWWAYWYRFGLADRAFEKWADPPIVAYHPTEIATGEDGNQRNFTAEALALAEKLRSGANVSLPSSTVESMIDGRLTNVRQWELTQLKTETNFDALNQAFEYLDVSKLRALMIPEQAFLEGKGGTSSRNVASTLGDVFEESQAVLKAEIDDHINRYMIPQLLEANFGPGGPTCRIVTTGFDRNDVQTARAVVQAFAQNAPGRLGMVDFRSLLDRLGVPLLDAKAAGIQEAKIIEETVKSKAPETSSTGGSTSGITGGSKGLAEGDVFAAVDAEGNYYKPLIREVINLSERVTNERAAHLEDIQEERAKHFAIIERLIDRFFGREKPQPVELSEEEKEKEVTKAEERTLGLMEKLLDLFRRDRKAQELVIRVAEEDEDDAEAA